MNMTRHWNGVFLLLLVSGKVSLVCDFYVGCHIMLSPAVSVRLFMGISDEIEDATIAIDETKISEIEATKRRFRNYCVQTKY